MMSKHGNTFALDDAVVKVDTNTNVKVASDSRGRVVGGDTDSGKLQVAWGNGHVDWHSPDDLKGF